MPDPKKVPIEIIQHIVPISGARAAWFVDIWGVMHNGVVPFDRAVAACQTFRQQGGVVILVSNSPRPNQGVAEQLDAVGVARDAYDLIVSSGDASKKLIHDLGALPVFHLGPARDLSIYDGFEGTRVPEAEAEAIVCTGLFDDETETPQDYTELLTHFAGRGLPMICVNPDMRVERGGKLVYCAGALANAYSNMGGQVHFAGKPYPPIYAMAQAALCNKLGRKVSTQEILAIGDGVHTDIEGAGRAGIDAVFVASRVHVSAATLDGAALAELFEGQDFPAPIAAMTELVW